jgi:hypothetical protein
LARDLIRTLQRTIEQASSGDGRVQRLMGGAEQTT